jgi:ABC-type antimicrobial peptide transport system permease subunit
MSTPLSQGIPEKVQRTLGRKLLIALQNSKNAAILRVLGTTKRRTLAVICAEQLFVCLFGLAIGLCTVMILGWGGAAALALAGLYLAGMLVGAVVGGAIITGRPPLELLQVKE